MDPFIYGMIGPSDTDRRSWPFPGAAPKSQLIADWSIKCRFLESASFNFTHWFYAPEMVQFHTFIFCKKCSFINSTTKLYFILLYSKNFNMLECSKYKCSEHGKKI